MLDENKMTPEDIEAALRIKKRRELSKLPKYYLERLKSVPPNELQFIGPYQKYSENEYYCTCKDGGKIMWQQFGGGDCLRCGGITY